MIDTGARWRLVAGILCLVAAAVVGVVGYVKLSVEPSLNHQLPYLASAGMTLVLLSVTGAALLNVDHLRTDEGQMAELAAAIERLADALASDVERPARRAVPTSSGDVSPSAPPRG